MQKIWAHRGASGYMPENTLLSFQEAIDQGADGIELDIQLSKDGEIVVIHDETIDRTSDGTGWVKDLTLSQLRSYHYNFQNGQTGFDGPGKEKQNIPVYPEYEQVDIPTMREVFELIEPTDLTINIEIKTGIVFYEGIEEKILAMTKEFGMEERVIYSSFNHYTVTKLKALSPAAKTGFLYADGPIDMPSYAKKHGVDAVHPALYNLQYPDFVASCKKNGLAIHVWTVNLPEHMKLCAAAGVDAVITNVPDLARKVLKEG